LHSMLFSVRHLPCLDSTHLTGFRYFGFLPKPVMNELGLGICLFLTGVLLLTSCFLLLTSCFLLLTSCVLLLTSCVLLLTSCVLFLTSSNGVDICYGRVIIL